MRPRSAIKLLGSDDRDEAEVPNLPICHPPLLPGPDTPSPERVYCREYCGACVRGLSGGQKLNRDETDGLVTSDWAAVAL